MEIDGIKIPTLAQTDQRFSLLLWGLAGCGKTTWAASAPGRKLLINFDPDGPTSLGARDDIVLIDLSGEKYTVVDLFKNDDDPILPLMDKKFRLSKILTDLEIETLIVDSCTAFRDRATEKGISVTKGATVERVSPGGYGARNALTLRMMSGLNALTKRMKVNIIFITHEDDSGVRNNDGDLLHITMLLGGKLSGQTALQLSEVWFMMDDGKQRKVLIRPGRTRKPMKSRMFDTTGPIEFVLHYKQDNDDPCGKHSIASFIKEWKDNGFNKIQVPK